MLFDGEGFTTKYLSTEIRLSLATDAGEKREFGAMWGDTHPATNIVLAAGAIGFCLMRRCQNVFDYFRCNENQQFAFFVALYLLRSKQPTYDRQVGKPGYGFTGIGRS